MAQAASWSAYGRQLVEAARGVLGPSKRELQAQIAHLQERQVRFPRRNTPVASGVEMGWGDFETDYNTKFNGAQRFGILDRMEADPHVKGVLLEKALPLLTAEWEIKPASDSNEDARVAAFCAANLLRQSSEDFPEFGRDYWIGTSWKAQRLPEIMAMLRDGFSMFVSTWKRVGMNQVYDRLQWVEPATIDGTQPWELSEQDEIVAVNRKLTTPGQAFIIDERIEAERLKLYVWDLKGSRFEGRSFVRSMYGAWLRKEFILRQSTIWAQKVGAPIPIGHYPSGWDGPQIAEFKRFVQATRGESPAEAYGMFKKTADGTEADVKYVGAETGEVDRMRGLVQGENEEIHQGARDSAAMLGETQSGSRALGDSKGSRELKFTEALGEIVAEWENHGVGNLTGVIEELCDRNFTVSAYPELVCTKVDPLANFEETVKAWDSGIIPKTADARRQIVEGSLGLNLVDEDYEVEEPLPLPPGTSPQPGNGQDVRPAKAVQDDLRQVAAAALAARDEFTQRIAPLLEPVQEGAPKSGGRFPNRLEREVCALAEIQESFRVGERDVTTELRATRTAMIDELMQRLRDGKITTRNLNGMRRSAFHGARQAKVGLRRVLRGIGRAGIKHVQDELERQQATVEAA